MHKESIQRYLTCSFSQTRMASWNAGDKSSHGIESLLAAKVETTVMVGLCCFPQQWLRVAYAPLFPSDSNSRMSWAFASPGSATQQRTLVGSGEVALGPGQASWLDMQMFSRCRMKATDFSLKECEEMEPATPRDGNSRHCHLVRMFGPERGFECEWFTYQFRYVQEYTRKPAQRIDIILGDNFQPCRPQKAEVHCDAARPLTA